ncbi:3849_t:CDS:2 [Ambispora leptoticha]|uniref:3849_t:CDS:1 n=1 Tax=Ambispora leptoticha TaxID=144679 RepID=A0A9N9A5W8_9GLOM|nr:3849_t:CDS:2 [Ambispora leptoticha]
MDEDDWLIEITFDDVKEMFDPVVKCIIDLIEQQLEESKRDLLVKSGTLFGGNAKVARKFLVHPNQTEASVNRLSNGHLSPSETEPTFGTMLEVNAKLLQTEQCFRTNFQCYVD